MTPVKKYVEANVTSGGMRAEIVVHKPKGNPGESTEPTAMVELGCKPTTILTHESLISFTAEISQIVAEERDGEEPHGTP